MKGTFRKTASFFVIILLSLGVYGYYTFFHTNESPASTNALTTKKNQQKQYEHTFPKKNIKNNFFIGEFVRNDVVSIFPRRQALVRDILVDVGDEVKKGQTLALLFEPGVAGQSASNIAIKSTQKKLQQDALRETIQVYKAKLTQIDVKIKEKQVLLKNTELQEQEKLVNINNDYEEQRETLKLQLSEQMQKLQILKEDLSKRRELKQKKIEEVHIEQQENELQIQVKLDEIKNHIFDIVYIGRDPDYASSLYSQSISIYLSAKNSSLREDFLSRFERYLGNIGNYKNIEKQAEEIQALLNLSRQVLEASVVSLGEISQENIEKLLRRTQELETSLILLDTKYHQIKNKKQTLELSENRDILLLEEQIKLQEIQVSQTQSRQDFHIQDNTISLSQADFINSTEALQQEITILKAERESLIASQNMTLIQAENIALLAEVELQKEYVESGDYKIISPYSGIVSKRSIDIGSMVSLGTEAFRLVGVENSLSRITKQEIKFFVPEALQDQIYIGQEVYFNTGGGSKPIRATIYRIAPEIDFETRSITVQAKVDDDIELSSMTSIRVELASQEEVYTIPSSSLYVKNDRNILYYKKDNGKLGVKDVVIISDDGEQALVSGDFDDTLKVVTTPIFIK